MGFWKKLCFWRRRRRKDAITTSDTATTTDNLTSETDILICDAGTQMDSNLSCEASTQTEEPDNQTDGGAADKEREELKSIIAIQEKFLDGKDRSIRKLTAIIQETKQGNREIGKFYLLKKIRNLKEENLELRATIQHMKEEKGSEFKYITTEKEIGKCALLRKIRNMREEIVRISTRIEEMEAKQGRKLKFITTQEEIGKCAPLRKNINMREEIARLSTIIEEEEE